MIEDLDYAVALGRMCGCGECRYCWVYETMEVNVRMKGETKKRNRVNWFPKWVHFQDKNYLQDLAEEGI